MKILSCYIAGFGKFVNQSFDFTSDLTVIKENNGWGKTTLADFLRCMLYGMDGGRSKAVENNDRLRYAPWQGGAYGGALTFECGGARYRVERSFGKTPAYDMARVYDKNNMQSFVFGDKAERLGEMLLGVDAESYRKSVYIPQGEIETGGLPDDMKNRLLALLNTGGVGETGAERALEKLDAADRALRAKRRPAKGKLDEIDERLSVVSAQKAACDNALSQAKQIRTGLADAERQLVSCNEQLRALSAALENASRENELALQRQTYTDLQTRYKEAKAELARLNEFFGSVNPAAVNTEGIGNAIGDFYAQKMQLQETEDEFLKTEALAKEVAALKKQAETCERLLGGYSGQMQGAGTERKPKGKKILPKKKKYTKWVVAAGLLLAVAGAVLADKLPFVGIPMLGVGLVAMLVMFISVLPRREKTAEAPVQAEDSTVPDGVQAGLEEIRKQLAQYPSDAEEKAETLRKAKEEGRAQLAAREQAIRNFLSNFRFGEIYDYRAAVEALREKIAAHERAAQNVNAYEKRLSELGEGMDVSPAHTPVSADMGALKAQIRDCERQKEELTQYRARSIAQAESLEASADKASLSAEENALLTEKTRLEKRHRAILAAREFLLRAKENMATRYLQPVEKGCRYYLSVLEGGNADSLRFAADGSPLYEDKGGLRALAYYSAGSRELVGFCTRLAFLDATFLKERPVLVLDDPFVNLDDKKTEKAKRLVKELSKKYQIIYFTCKTERKI